METAEIRTFRTGKGPELPRRNEAVEVLRVFAAFAVVIIHTKPFEYASAYYGEKLFGEIAFWLQACAKFAVPYFFMTAAFFFSRAMLKEPSRIRPVFRKYFGRILSLVLFWCLIYAIFPANLVKVIIEHGIIDGWPRAIYWDIVLLIKKEPLEFLTQGTSVHLWFLIFLLPGYSLLYLAERFGKRRCFYLFSLLTVLTGLFAGTYARTPWGVNAPFEILTGQWHAWFYLALGYYFSRREVLSRRQALCLATAGAAISLVEASVLKYGYGYASMPYGFGCILFTSGLFQTALTLSRCPAPPVLLSLSRLTLGVYLIHVFLLHSILPFQRFFPPLLWDLFLAPLIFAASACAAAFMRKNKALMNYVS